MKRVLAILLAVLANPAIGQTTGPDWRVIGVRHSGPVAAAFYLDANSVAESDNGAHTLRLRSILETPIAADGGAYSIVDQRVEFFCPDRMRFLETTLRDRKEAVIVGSNPLSNADARDWWSVVAGGLCKEDWSDLPKLFAIDLPADAVLRIGAYHEAEESIGRMQWRKFFASVGGGRVAILIDPASLKEDWDGTVRYTMMMVTQIGDTLPLRILTRERARCKPMAAETLARVGYRIDGTRFGAFPGADQMSPLIAGSARGDLASAVCRRDFSRAELVEITPDTLMTRLFK